LAGCRSHSLSMTVARRMLQGTLIVDRSAPEAFGKSGAVQPARARDARISLTVYPGISLAVYLAIEHRLVRH
jgi:hypothetical protein